MEEKCWKVTIRRSLTKVRPLLLLTAALLPYVTAAAQERQDVTGRLVNPSFETGSTSGWTYGQIADGDIGVRENSNAIYTTAGCNGKYLYNTWYSSNSYAFVAPNQFVEQTVKALPAGEYRLVVLAASDTYSSVNSPVEIYANDAVLSVVPPHMGTFTQYELPFFVSPRTLNVKLGARSKSWFKVDHFRLYFLGETADYRTATGEGLAGRHPQLVELFNGLSASGWSFVETTAHTHGDFPVVTNNMDLTPFEASKFQYWTGPAYQLGNARITYNYTGMTPGWYELRSWVRVYDENGDFDGTASGLQMICGSGTTAITEGSEIADGSLSGLGFMGQYSVRGKAGADGQLTIGFVSQNCSFNWLSWYDARLYYLGTDEPIDTRWFDTLKALGDVAEQAAEQGGFPAVYQQAQADLLAARGNDEAEAVIGRVRQAVISLIKTQAAKDGHYDLTGLLINADLKDGTRGWSLTGANLKVSEAGVGSVKGTSPRGYIRQQLTGMPAGHYTLMAQGFGPQSKAVLRLDSKTAPLNDVTSGRRFYNSRTSGIESTIDGTGIPVSVAAVPAYFESNDYWNIIEADVAEDGNVTVGIDINAAQTATDWTAFGHFRLLYGSEVPDVLLTEDDASFSLDTPRPAHVVLQRTFKAGVLTPLCVPFELTASNDMELYAVGQSDGKTARLYPVRRVKAGVPCVIKLYEDRESIDFGRVVLNPVAADMWLLPWGGGRLIRYYIKTVRRESNYSWKFCADSSTNEVAASSLSFLLQDPMHMDITATLENYNVRQFLNAKTYTLSNSSVILDYYRQQPPFRRDIPNPVMIPVDVEAADIVAEVSETSDFAASKKWTVKAGDNAYIPNLIPQHSYFFRVMADGETVSRGQIHTDGRLRMIYAPSANNIRDLGGWPTSDRSKRTTYGHIFRGSELNGAHVATAADLQVLRDLGITAEIDLRWNSSWDNDGVGISAFGFTDTFYFASGNDWLAEDFAKEESQRHWREEFQLVVNTLRQGHAIYFHCVWGADRTGLFALLLEGILGLDIDAYFKDYELTSYSLAGSRVKTDWQDRLEYINGLEGSTLRDKFENYFVNTLKISKDDIEFYRSVMLEPVTLQPELISEETDYVCSGSGKTDATLVITLQPGIRNAVVLPFSLNSTLLRQAFGSGSKAESITAFDGRELTTKKLSTTTAHVPFLLTPTTVKDDHRYELTNVTLELGGPQAATFTGGSLQGVYDATTPAALLTSFGPQQTSYVLQDGRFYRSDSDTEPLRGLHAYVTLDTPNGADPVVYFLGENPDGIETLKAGDNQRSTADTPDNIFDLQGRRITTHTSPSTLRALPKGIYIIGGRKVVIH